MMKVLRAETPGHWAPPLSGPCLTLPSASRQPNLFLSQSVCICCSLCLIHSFQVSDPRGIRKPSLTDFPSLLPFTAQPLHLPSLTLPGARSFRPWGCFQGFGSDSELGGSHRLSSRPGQIQVSIGSLQLIIKWQGVGCAWPFKDD